MIKFDVKKQILDHEYYALVLWLRGQKVELHPIVSVAKLEAALTMFAQKRLRPDVTYHIADMTFFTRYVHYIATNQNGVQRQTAATRVYSTRHALTSMLNDNNLVLTTTGGAHHTAIDTLDTESLINTIRYIRSTWLHSPPPSYADLLAEVRRSASADRKYPPIPASSGLTDDFEDSNE